MPCGSCTWRGRRGTRRPGCAAVGEGVMMAGPTQTRLEPAAFYALYDGRDEGAFLFNLDQAEGAGAAASSPAGSAFAAPCPSGLAHIDAIIDQRAEGQLTVYCDIVSPAWRAAIEGVEPGVHQFIAHALRFADQVITDRFIFRCATLLEDAPRYVHVEEVNNAWDDVVGYRFAVDGSFDVPTLERAQVEGRHMVASADRSAHYVSRALAGLLLPLLPAGTALLPIRLSGEAMPEGASARGARPEGGDADLAESIRVFNEPRSDDARRSRAEALLQDRLARATVAGLFDVMAQALMGDVALVRNFAFNLGYGACYHRDEGDVRAFCRAWAADASPLRRFAVARVLARPIGRHEAPHPETFAMLTGLLDDRDPDVATETLRVLFWMNHPAYTAALRRRRDQFAGSASAKLREACRELIDGTPGPG